MPSERQTSVCIPGHRSGPFRVGGVAAVRVLTVQEFAERWLLSDQTVRKMIRAGDLPCVRFGRSLRIPQDEQLDEALARPSLTKEHQ